MQFINIEDRMSAGLGLPAAVEPLNAAPGLPALATAEADVTLYWAQLLILGSSEVVKAAQDWRNEAWQLESFARGYRNDPADFATAAQHRREARLRFYTAVRADLGIITEDIPVDLGIREL